MATGPFTTTRACEFACFVFAAVVLSICEEFTWFDHDFSKLEALFFILANLAGVIALWRLATAIATRHDVTKALVDLATLLLSFGAGWLEWFWLATEWPRIWGDTWPLLLIVNMIFVQIVLVRFGLSPRSSASPGPG